MEPLEPLIDGVPWVATRGGKTQKCVLGSARFTVEKSRLHWSGVFWIGEEVIHATDDMMTPKECRDELLAKKNELIRSLGGLPVVRVAWRPTVPCGAISYDSEFEL